MGTYLTRAKSLVREKGLDFSPAIARSGRHKLMQYNRVGVWGLIAEKRPNGVFPIDFSWGISRCMYSYLMSPTTNSAVATGPDFFCTGGEGMTPRSYTI